MVTHMGRVYLGVCHVSYPKRAEFHGAPILGVLLFLCLHPLTQNDQIRHGNTVTHVGNGMFLGGQPRHFICTNASRGLSATTEFLVSFALENMCVTLCPNQLWTHSRKDCILIEKKTRMYLCLSKASFPSWPVKYCATILFVTIA